MRVSIVRSREAIPVRSARRRSADVVKYFSMLDQWVEENPMPEEYRDLTQSIYCNDCEVTSVVPVPTSSITRWL